MTEKRKNWNDLISGFRASDLVFLDESGCNTDMTRRYADSFGGSRAVDFHSAFQAKEYDDSVIYPVGRDITRYDFLRWNNCRTFQTLFEGYFAASSERQFCSRDG